MTHPHDFALLNDLLDERLSPAAEDDLRRRLADEPALAATYAELVRMRDALAARPAPVAAPADFVAQVRVRAGLPPSVAAPAATRSVGPSGSGPSGSGPLGDTRAKGPGGPVGWRADAVPDASAPSRTPTHSRAPSGGSAAFSARSRFVVPIAAMLGIAFGAGLWLALRTDESYGDRPDAGAATLGAVAPAREDGAGAPPVEPSAAVALEGTTGAPSSPTPGSSAPWTGRGETGPIPSGTPSGGFRAPGGAVPDGLRAPSDAPGAPGEPAAGKKDAARTMDAAMDAATDAATESKAAPKAASKAASKGERGLRAGLRRAEEGVDEVLVIRAASLDEARAHLALLALAPIGDVRLARTLRVVERREVPDAAADEGRWGLAATDRLEAARKARDGQSAGDARPVADADVALGSFVMQLPLDALAAAGALKRLAARSTNDAEDAEDAEGDGLERPDAAASDAAKPGAPPSPGGAAAPPRAPVPPPSARPSEAMPKRKAADPAKGDDEKTSPSSEAGAPEAGARAPADPSADRDAPRALRRVRVVVLPR